MNSHPSVLVFSLYLLGGGLVLAVGRLVFLAYDADAGPRLPARSSAAQPTSAGPEQPADVVSHHALTRAHQRLQELQATVERTRELLDRRTAALHAKNSECDALRSELDESIALLFSVLAQESQRAAATPGTASRARQLESELNTLRAELAATSTLQREQAEQVDALRTALFEAELEIDELQRASLEELTLMANEQAALAAAARDVVRQSGATAVPLLTPLLRDARPSVRAWAAEALGRLGVDAASAVPTLTELLADQNSQVRTAARDALGRIEP